MTGRLSKLCGNGALLMAIALLVLPSLSTGAGADARSHARVVCQDAASLRHSPAGTKTGTLARGERVLLVDFARRKRWAYVLSKRGNGWVLTKALCLP